MNDINWDLIRSRLKEAVFALPHFFRNPVQGMRQLPDWDWATILILQGLFAAACAALGNLIEHKILRMFMGLFIAPIANYLVLAIIAGFFFYTLMFFFQREAPFKQVYTHILFASIPSMLVIMISGLIPQLTIFGIAASLYLLHVSFADHFQLERKKVKYFFIALMGICTFFWLIQVVKLTSRQEDLRHKATPESLDILENDFKSDN